jgi:hypothetical protein
MTHIAAFDQMAFVLLCAAEAWLEDIVIKLKNPSLQNYNQLNTKEHQRSAVYYVALVVCITVLTWEQIDYHIWLVIAAMFWRRVIFTYGLKFLRRRPLKFIEGDQYTDRIVRSVFGKNGGYWELLFLIGGLITINALFLL